MSKITGWAEAAIGTENAGGEPIEIETAALAVEGTPLVRENSDTDSQASGNSSETVVDEEAAMHESTDEFRTVSGNQRENYVWTLEMKILDELDKMTLFDNEEEQLSDISDTEIAGIKFLIKYACNKGDLDFFVIVQKILELKRKAELVGYDSPNLDSLIWFIEKLTDDD